MAFSCVTQNNYFSCDLKSHKWFILSHHLFPLPLKRCLRKCLFTRHTYLPHSSSPLSLYILRSPIYILCCQLYIIYASLPGVLGDNRTLCCISCSHTCLTSFFHHSIALSILYMQSLLVICLATDAVFLATSACCSRSFRLFIIFYLSIFATWICAWSQCTSLQGFLLIGWISIIGVIYSTFNHFAASPCEMSRYLQGSFDVGIPSTCFHKIICRALSHFVIPVYLWPSWEKRKTECIFTYI